MEEHEESCVPSWIREAATSSPLRNETERLSETVLRQLNEAFERRVQQRTADLAATNAALQCEIAERQRTEESLRRSEARMRAIFDTEPECVKLLDAECRLLDMNQAGLTMIEAESLDVVRGTSILPLIAPEYHKRFLSGIDRAFAGERVCQEFEIIGLRGTRRWMEQHAIGFRDPIHPKDVVEILAVTRDISERKRSEQSSRESNARTDLLIDSVPAYISYVDDQERYCWVNRSYEEWFQRPRGEIAGMTVRSLQGEANYRLIEPHLRQALRGQVVHYEQTLMSADNISRTFDNRYIPHVSENGRVVGVFVLVFDISAERATTRALRHSEERYRKLFETCGDAIFIVNSLGRICDANHSATRMHGYSREELLSMTIQELDDPESARLVPERLRRSLAGESLRFEVTHLRKDGTSFPVEVLATQMCQESETYIIAFDRDITERKRAEQALRESERGLRLFRTLINLSHDAVHVIDPSTSRFLDINQCACDRLGYTREEMLHLGVTDIEVLLPTEFSWDEHVQDVRMVGSMLLEGAHRRKDGTTFPVEVSVSYVTLERQNYMVAVIRDVTARRRVEQQLRDNEERLSLAVAAASMGLWDWDLVTGRAYLSPKCYELSGNLDLEIHTGRDYFKYFVHPDDQAAVREIMEKHIQGRSDSAAVEYRLQHNQREERWIKSVGKVVVRNADGAPLRMTGVLFDISDRKRAEFALSASKARLKEAQRIAQIGSWELDLTTSTLYWSEELFRIFEIDPTRFGASYEAFLNLVHPEDRERVDAAYSRSVETREPYEIVHRLQMLDGRTKFVRECCETEYDTSGRPLRSIGTTQDITEQQRMEESIRLSEERLRKTLDGMLEGCMLIDRDWKYLYCNPIAARQGRRQVEDVIGRRMLDLYPGIEQSAIFSRYHRCMVSREPQRFEEQFHFPGREVCWYEFSVEPVAEGIFVLCLDISQRKRAELAVQESEQRTRQMLDGLFGFVGRYSLDGILIDANEAPLRAAGLRREEVLGRPFWDTYWWNYDEQVQTELRAALMKAACGEVVRYEPQVRVLGGKLITIDVTFSPLRNLSGEITGILGFGVDITEQKRATDALRASEERYRQMLESLPVGVLVHNGKQTLYANPMAGKIFGVVRLKDLLARNPLELVTPQHQKLARRRTEMILQTGAILPPVESQLEKADGTLVDIEVRSIRTTFAGQECVQVHFQDVTERKQTEESLKLQAQVLHSMAEGVVFIDDCGAIVFTNPALDHMFGYESGELSGQAITSLNDASPQENQDIVEKLMAHLQCHTSWEGEFRNRKKDGTPFYTRARITTLQQPGRVFWVSVQEDITSRKLAEQQLTRLRDELTHLARIGAMGELTAGIAHELNQPLTALAADGHTLKQMILRYESKPGAQNGQFISLIADSMQSQALRAGEIIRRLQQLARKRAPTRSTVELCRLVDEVRALLYGEIQLLQIEFDVLIPDKLPFIVVDPIQIQQVLYNLCRNAIDAMREQAGHRRLIITAHSHSETHIAVHVRDWGPGVPEEMRDRIFTPFASSKPDGLGLGLAISRRIVEAHAGELEIVPCESMGFEIRCLLPIGATNL